MSYQDDMKNAALLRKRRFNYIDGWKDQKPNIMSFFNATNTLENFHCLA